MLLKIVGFVVCSIGAFQVYQWLPEPSVRAKMLKVFKRAGLYLTIHKNVKIYPKIQRIEISEYKTVVVFTLPTGVEPKIKEKEWVFMQVFGENLEIKSGPKTQILTIYNEKLKPFPYNWEEIEPELAGRALPIYCGKSQAGPIVYDMVEHPHLLIAGETGSGKSTQLRSILTSLVLYGTNVRLFLADLKRSEFHLFRNVAERVAVTVDELSEILVDLRVELVRRGNLLDKEGVANVDELKQKLPYIILAIDEVALLQKEKFCMDILEEISAIGRALGVFLILSMQRPDSKVLDGKLKHNLTVRMAFRHFDETNSRITLDSGEAARIGQSDRGAFYLKLNNMTLGQAPHLTLEQAKTLLSPFRSERGGGDLENILGVLSK